MKSTSVIGLILLAGMGATAANAGVLYDFSGFGGSTQSVSFQLMLPDFLNPPVGGQAVTFACSALNTSVNCDTQQTWGVFFSVGLWGAGAGYVDTILFQSSNNSAYWFYFQSG